MMKNNSKYKRAGSWGFITMCLLITTACGTKKVLTEPGQNTQNTTTVGTTANQPSAQQNNPNVEFVRLVNDQAAYAKDVVAKIDFTINRGGKDITLGGQLHMRKDDVIRIQLTPLGIVEVGRIEFTKDEVLFMNRVHKEYIKANYSDVDFLNNNGLDFYALQALFWNTLYMPGSTKVGEAQAADFKVSPTADGKYNVAAGKGKMNFTWTADSNGRIEKALAAYNDSKYGQSTLTWKYDDFKAMGSKMFPCLHQVEVKAAAKTKKTIQVSIKIKKLTNDSDWEGRTSVPSKYQKVSVDDVLNQIMKL